MTITANTYSLTALPLASVPFYKSLQSEDVSSGEEIATAVSGATHYLTRLLIRADAAMDVSVGSGETAGAVTTVHMGPIPLAAASGSFLWEAPPGMGLKCTVSTAIVIDSSAGGTVWVEAHGKTCTGSA